jgi:hypothetical protein
MAAVIKRQFIFWLRVSNTHKRAITCSINLFGDNNMSKHQTKKLFSDLEVHLGSEPSSEVSDAQRTLMQQVKNHIHAENEPEPSEPDLQETLELLLLDIEQNHPKAAIVVREILKTLGDIGV